MLLYISQERFMTLVSHRILAAPLLQRNNVVNETVKNQLLQTSLGMTLLSIFLINIIACIVLLFYPAAAGAVIAINLVVVLLVTAITCNLRLFDEHEVEEDSEF